MSTTVKQSSTVNLVYERFDTSLGTEYVFIDSVGSASWCMIQGGEIVSLPTCSPEQCAFALAQEQRYAEEARRREEYCALNGIYSEEVL